MQLIGKKLNSHSMSVFEALAFSFPRGLTIPQIVSIAQVPKSTVARIVDSFEERGIIIPADKKGKAIVWSLDDHDHEVVELTRAIHQYVVSVSEIEARARGLEPAGTAPPMRQAPTFVAVTTADWTQRTTGIQVRQVETI